MIKRARGAALRAAHGGLFVSGIAATATAIVVGVLNAGAPDLTFVIVSGGLWTLLDFVLALDERDARERYVHTRVRARLLLLGVCVAAAFFMALIVSSGGYVKEMATISALTIVSFSAAILTLKLHERRDSSEVDWRARLAAKAPSLAFLVRPKRNVLIIGASLDSRMVAAAISYSVSALRVVGALRFDGEDAERPVAGAPVLGRISDLDDVVAQLKIHGQPVHALVAPCLTDRGLPDTVVKFVKSRPRGQEIVILNDLSEIKAFARLDDELGGSWSDRRRIRRRMLHASRSWSSARQALPKRVFDLLASATLLTLAAPAFALAALGVRFSLGSPVFFWQERAGRFGRPFRVFKLRSMKTVDRRSGERTSDQARVTRFGSLLRRTRLDEAPQLWSVLRGQMSLVGPRPLLPEDMPRLAEARLLIRPGITGWAQVNGGHQLTPEEKIALDVWYARRASVWLDLWILMRSVRVVLTGDIRKEAAIAEARQEFDAFVAALQAAIERGEVEVDQPETFSIRPASPARRLIAKDRQADVAARRRLAAAAESKRGSPAADAEADADRPLFRKRESVPR